MYYTKFNNRWRNTLKDEAMSRFTVINDKGEYILNDPTQLAAVNKGHNYVSVEGSSSLYFHSGYVEDGSFLKINRIYLYTWTKYSGYDPEVNTCANNGLTPGIDWGAYPSAISVVFGANITF